MPENQEAVAVEKPKATKAKARVRPDLNAEVTVKLWPGERQWNGADFVGVHLASGERHSFWRGVDDKGQPRPRAPFEATMTRRAALQLRQEGFEVDGLG